MKTKEEILKMNKKKLLVYKWSNDLDKADKVKKENIDCSYCSNCSSCRYLTFCSYCSYCSNCSDCFGCRNLNDGKKHQYKICNVQFTKEEYEKKIDKLSEE